MSTKRCANVAFLLAVVLLLGAGLALAQGSVEDFERKREKAKEMLEAINDANYNAFGEGKDSALERVYGDYNYLVKELLVLNNLE